MSTISKERATVRAYYPDRGFGFLERIEGRLILKFYFIKSDFVYVDQVPKISIGSEVEFVVDYCTARSGRYPTARNVELVESKLEVAAPAAVRAEAEVR